MLNGVIEKELYKAVEGKINTNYVAALYNFSQLFSSSNASKPPLQFIECCFQMFVDSSSFLELDLKLISKVLSSSELNIDSEMQVFNAVVSWLGHNEKRSKYAKYLFLKVGIFLLSDPALKLIKEKVSCIIDDFPFINKVIKEKNLGPHSKSMKNVCRYCTHKNFNIFFCGGMSSFKVVRDVYSVKADELKTVKNLPILKKCRQRHEVILIKGDIFVFGGIDVGFKCITSIEKYSDFSIAWEIIAHLPDERVDFCVSSYMGYAYVLGGCFQQETINSCLMFNPGDCSWKEVAEMNETRCYASCTVFEGKIVVSGGLNNNRSLTTVEAYDHVANTWTNMPNMIEERYHHKSVAVKNKLFIVGGIRTSCEVYDLNCGKFNLLKFIKETIFEHLKYPINVLSIKNKLYVFNGYKKNFLLYDVEKNDWSKEPFSILQNLNAYSCVKFPQF